MSLLLSLYSIYTMSNIFIFSVLYLIFYYYFYALIETAENSLCKIQHEDCQESVCTNLFNMFIFTSVIIFLTPLLFF